MEQDMMLILLLTLILQYDLLHCANSNTSLDKDLENKTRINDELMTEVLFNTTPEEYQTDLVTPDLTITLGNGTNTHDDDTPSLSSTPTLFSLIYSIATSSKRNPIHPEAFPLRSLLNPLPEYILPEDLSLRSQPISTPESIYPDISTTEHTTAIINPLETTPAGMTFSSANVARSLVSFSLPGFGPGPTGYPAETPPINFDPNVAEFAKKWLQGIASTTRNPKVVVPKLSKILDYDHHTVDKNIDGNLSSSAQGFPLIIRRNQRKISDQTPPLTHREVTSPQISKRSHKNSEAKSFWHDPPSTLAKKRLKPALLLGKATISAVGNKEDVEGPEIEGRERIMRMHHMVGMTKKQWYSDRTEAETEEVETTVATEKEILRQHGYTELVFGDIISSEATTPSTTPTSVKTTVSTTQTEFKMAERTPSVSTMKEETLTDGYLLVFLKELSRIISTKEKKAVHDVVKHADEIVHGFHKTGQLQWFGQPLIDFTRKLARSLKEWEIDVIQNNAADLHQTLSQPRQLSQEASMILERAASLYDADDGAHLSEVLEEFVAYPNSTLSSYWLCNSLINNFLRPYRRLSDTRQREQLTDSVNQALRSRFATNGAKALRGGVRYANEPPAETEHSSQKEPLQETKRAPRERKRKHHHRSRKRKRERKRHRMQRYIPDRQESGYVDRNREIRDEDLLLRSMKPRTEQPRVIYNT